MRVIALEAENFKKLKAVEIRPGSSVVQITGKNRQGKSSVLDALWLAIRGMQGAPPEPIRDGEERARIRVELGNERPELIVTRTFKAKADDEGGGYTTTLKVENGEGAKFKAPQEVLDAIVGALSFDPLEFERAKDPERLAMMRPLVPGVDFDALTAANKADFEARTPLNLRAKNARANAEAIKLPPGRAPQRVDVAALEEELAGSAQFNGDVEARKANRAAAIRQIEQLEADEADLRAKLTALEEQRLGLQQRLAEAPALPELKDILAIRQKLTEARAQNEAAAAAERKAAIVREAQEAEDAAAALTKAMDHRKATMAKAVADAVATVPGLSFNAEAERLELNGEPFDQASDGERLEASILVAGLLNPTLRVIRVRDGSRLDEDAIDALAAQAERLDLQVWLERVDSSGSVGFVMENGELKGPGTAPSPRPLMNSPAADIQDEEAV